MTSRCYLRMTALNGWMVIIRIIRCASASRRAHFLLLGSKMFKTIGIIGIGMIGGSVALAARASDAANKIIALDISRENISYAHGAGMIDNAGGTDFAQIADCDLIILAVPVRSYAAVLQNILPHVRQDAVVSDVGSTKRGVVQVAEKILPASQFIGGHPIAGLEKHGPQHADAKLFHERWTILTPGDAARAADVEKLKTFWEKLGSHVAVMDAAHHDRVLAITSHLPQLIARTIVGTAAALEDELQDEVIKFSAGGFRDFTRMAAADPIMWRDVFLENGDAVLEMLQRLQEDIAVIQKLIRVGDGAALEEIFTRARDIRGRVIAAHQA
jgi:cyclohexadieny/prephenate dehydrogenase